MSKAEKYSEEFKLDALNLLPEGKNISEIPKILQYSLSTPYIGDASVISFMTIKRSKVLPKNEQQEELRRLKKENAELKMEPDILKKALSIFSKKDQ